MSEHPITSSLGTWPLRSLPVSTCSPVFVRDYGHLVKAEYRVGPEVTCEAVAIKCADGWVIDGIETLPTWRCHGHARAVLERIVAISGMPVRAIEIDPDAKDFWEHMTALGINLANVLDEPRRAGAELDQTAPSTCSLSDYIVSIDPSEGSGTEGVSSHIIRRKEVK